MDLKQLEYFVRVAELGSFTRASIALDIAQPALSRQIRFLEVELRQSLLTRNGRGAVPTEAGKLLLKHGRGILHQVEVAREELGTVRGAVAGRVAIGLPPSLSRLITVPLAQAFRQQMPLAQLTLTEGFSLSMQESLRIGNLDIAVLYNTERSSELEIETLHAEELVLISPQITTAPEQATQQHTAGRKSISLAEVATLPLVLPSRPNAFRILVERDLFAIGCKPQVALEVDGLNAILSLVKEGIGHAILPSYTLKNFHDAKPFALRTITAPRIMSELMLVRSSRRASTETQKLTADLVTAVVKDALKACTVS